MGSKRSPYSRTSYKERKRETLRDPRQRSFTPERREHMWNSLLRSSSPELTLYSRRQNSGNNNVFKSHENSYFKRQEHYHRLDDYRNDSFRNSSRGRQRRFDPFRDNAEMHDRHNFYNFDSRDRSRSPISSRDYNRKSKRHDDSPTYWRSNSFDYASSFDGYDGYESNRGETSFMGKSGFDEQRRKHNIKDRRYHLRESDIYSSNPRTPLLICKFYNNKGTCEKGQACDYLHVCKYFINDDCKFGRGCMRSHNVLDLQPRSILERYDMVPRHFSSMSSENVRKITHLVKEELNNQEKMANTSMSKKAFTMHLDSNKAAKNPTNIYDGSSPSDQTSDDEIFTDEEFQDRRERTFTRSLPKVSSSLSTQEDKDEQSQNLSEEFIPLEHSATTDAKALKKRKSLKLKGKSNMPRRRGKIRDKNEVDEPLPIIQDKDIKNSPSQSAITFHFSDPCGKYQLRKDNSRWQVSTVGEDWLELTEFNEEIAEELYCKATEAKTIFDRMMTEQKL